MTRPVTAEELSDDEIIRAIDFAGAEVSLRDAWFAVSDAPDGPRKIEARARIAAAINARNGGGR